MIMNRGVREIRVCRGQLPVSIVRIGTINEGSLDFRTMCGEKNYSIGMKTRAFLLLVVNGLALALCLLFVRTGTAQTRAEGEFAVGDSFSLFSGVRQGNRPSASTGTNWQPVELKVGLNGAVCAFSSIGEAIAAASSGDVIYISSGNYPEKLGKINLDLTLTASSEDCTQADDLPQYAVDIDANDLGAAFGGVIDLGANQTLTLTNLYLSDGTASFGGLIYVPAGSTVILDDTDLGYGTASQFGGAIRSRGTVEFRNGSTLFGSRATGSGSGGGVSLVGSGQMILREDSTVGFCGEGFDNRAAGDGGGVYLDGGLLALYNSSRVCNSIASGNGGGIYATGTAVINLFDQASIGGPDTNFGNAAQIGAGAYLTGAASLALVDYSKVQFNVANVDGGGVAVQGHAELVLGEMGASIMDNLASVHGGGVWIKNETPGDNPQAFFLHGSVVAQNSADYGGGIYVEGVGARAWFSDTVIRQNQAVVQGGGLQVHSNARVSIVESSIEENEAIGSFGGGIAFLPGSGDSVTLSISNTNVTGNLAETDGGGIYVDAGTLILNNTVVSGNTAGDHGGGLAALNDAEVISMVTMPIPGQLAEYEWVHAPCDPAALPADTYCAEFRDNMAETGGGALYVSSGTTLEVSYTAFLGNQTEGVGSAVYSDSPGDDVSLRNSLLRENMGGNVVRVFFGTLFAEHNTFAGNPATAVSLGWANPPATLANNVIWDNADGVVSSGASVVATCSISQNGIGGQVRDPEFVTGARGAYHLGLDSDALDVCDNGPIRDLDNLIRPVASMWDMGAFERHEYIPIARADAYTTTQETSLVVTAPGVLANDSDANGDPLTAALDTGPTHGSVTLNMDGSFTYLPAEDYLGGDQFTYTVTDGADIVTATVEINIVEGARPVYLPAILRNAG